MAVEWQSRDFLTDWTGLYNRRQSIDVPASYSRTTRNVDFYGSAIGKRQGTQIVNGWGTLVTGLTWTVVSPGTIRGDVVDASGFRVGDVVYFAAVPGGVEGSGTITAIAGSTLTLGSVPVGYVPTPGVTAAYTRRNLAARIDGLYHAIFRDGTELLVAAAGAALWNVWATPVGTPVGASYTPGIIARRLPATTIPTTWANATTGPLTSVETLVGLNGGNTWYSEVMASNSPLYISAMPPDILQIFHGPQTDANGLPLPVNCIYEGRVAHFSGAVGNYVVTLEQPASQPPQAGDMVVIFPHRTADDTRFTMLNNRVFVTSAAGKNTAKSGAGWQATQNQPPTVIEQQNGVGPTTYERRMGVRPPTHWTQGPGGEIAPIDTGDWTSGVGHTTQLLGTYNWRYTYVNTLNGQESEASPKSPSTSLGLPANPPTTPLDTFSSASLTVRQSPDPQVTAIRVYRTLANQDGSWYFVAQLANANQTYIDNIADTALGQLLKTFSNEPPPDSTTVLAVWTTAGTLIGIDNGQITAGGEQVVWGDAPDIVNGLYKLESWPLNNTLFVNRDDGDHLVGLGVFYDSVVVWKGRSMHRIIGAPPDIILQPISFRDDHTGVGIWSAKGFIMDTDVAIFVSDDGFYQVSRYEGVQQGFTSTRISRAIDQEFRFRTSQLSSAQRQFRERSHLLYHRVKRRLQVFVPVDGNPDPTDMFIYQAEGTVEGMPHGWSLWSVPADYTDVGGNPAPAQSYISASCMVHSAMGMDVPYYGLGPRGLVVKADTGAGDWQGFPVTLTSDTVWFSGGGAGTVCRCRAVDFVFIPTAGLPAPILRVGTDFDVTDVNTTSRYQLPQLGALGVPVNENPLILDLGQYLSIGVEETSITGLFLVEDFTLWFQRLPVGVTPRLIPVPIAPTEF